MTIPSQARSIYQAILDTDLRHLSSIGRSKTTVTELFI